MEWAFSIGSAGSLVFHLEAKPLREGYSRSELLPLHVFRFVRFQVCSLFLFASFSLLRNSILGVYLMWPSITTLENKMSWKINVHANIVISIEHGTDGRLHVQNELVHQGTDYLFGSIYRQILTTDVDIE